MSKYLKVIGVLGAITILIILLTTTQSQGIFNISLALLSIYTALIFMGSLVYKKKDDEKEIPFLFKWFMRAWIVSLPLLLIYKGFIVMGMLWIVSGIIVYSKRQEQEDGQS